MRASDHATTHATNDASTVTRLTLVQHLAALRSGALPLLGHVAATLDAVAAANPALLAVLPEQQRRTRLLLEAQALVERWPDVATRPPLFGLLVGIKDVLHVDGLPTRAGSALPSEVLTAAEGALVRQLRELGALVFGKTVTAEFAFADTGATCNPRNPSHTPGGSSSGSAAAVAAGLLPLAIGTQTVGSVIRPAAYCGVVGFKPSSGVLPSDGIVAVAPSVDTPGLFTADVEGMACIARVLLGAPRASQRAAPDADAGIADAQTSASPLRLLAPDGPFMAQVDAPALQLFEATLRRLAEQGVTITRIPFFADLPDLARRHTRLVQREFAAGHAAWYATWGALYRPLSAQGVRGGHAVSADDYAEALASTQMLRARMETALAKHHALAWVCPAATGVAPAGLQYSGNPAMAMPFSHAGVPAVTMPCGQLPTPGGDLPLGLQLGGGFGADLALLDVACRVDALLRAASD